MDFFVLLLTLLVSVTACFTAKIVMLPQFGRSHYIVMEKLGNELKRRGHDVSILVGGEGSYAIGKPNVKVFEVPEELKDDRREHVKSMSKGSQSRYETLVLLFNNQKSYCDLFLSSDDMRKELKAADILIGDSLYLCSTLVADMFDLPHVLIAMSSLQTPTFMPLGVSSNPAYVPQIFSWLPRDMGFIDRIKNLGSYLSNLYIIERYLYPEYQELKLKYNIKPEKSIQQTMATVDLILLTMSIVMDHAQPLPPYVREVGNFLPSPPKPLPAELEEFYERSGDNGVILVTFGSMLDTLSDQIIGIMNKAFSRMSQNILWRINLGKYKDPIAPNIKVVQWVPQNDVLGHHKTRLFFTHAGANGMAEAVYHGVPMLCAPFFSDQFDNAQALKDSGFGEIVDLRSVTVEQLTKLMTQIMHGKRYREGISHATKVLKLRPRSPVQEAAELVEYVYAVGNLKHLKPRSHDLPFYQLYMLDVLLVFGIGLSIVLCILAKLAKLLIKNCSRPAGKSKTS